jgi:hypothetical protein
MVFSLVMQNGNVKVSNYNTAWNVRRIIQ